MPQTVLIIEDTRSFALLLQQLVATAHGFAVDIAGTYKEAKALLQEKAEAYFVAIVDLNLPDAPKGEAVELLESFNIPAVVFTGTNDQAIKEDLWARGIADYAHKSGSYSLEYVQWVVNRIYKNRQVEVLVVDDSKVARAAIVRTLGVQNYKVHAVQSGDEALAALSSYPGIRIAIVDQHMENMDGLALTSAIRELKNSTELEIIGLSGVGEKAMSAQFIKAGANDFLVKPFLPEELLCRVNRSADRLESFIDLLRLNNEKNRLLGTAAHDIRGPLGSIKTAANMLLNRNMDESKATSFLSMIERNSVHLLNLLETLLDVSVIESGQTVLNKSEVDLSALVSERIELYQGEAQAKQLEIRVNIQEALSLNLDEVKIKQLVDNLITNAIKYSPRNNPVEISLSAGNNSVVFCVADNGPGINKKEQQQLFKAYAVLSSEATGGEKKTGLGLAIAKNIVDAHGGKIYYKDRPGGGASFSFELPLAG